MHDHQSSAQAAVGPPPYLTIAQVCRRLHISKVTLWGLRRKGEIRAFHVGRRVLFKSDDVVALVERDGAEPQLQPA